LGRHKGYDRDRALEAARDLFWERGYEATSITELEQRTGLNRSSLYQEFGSKHDLFEAALECYADRVITNVLAVLRDESQPGLDSVIALFREHAQLFLQAPVNVRGCLLVNTTAELAARDERVRPAAAGYRDRLRADFTAALSRAVDEGELEPALVESRAQILASALMGAWLTVRIDPRDASQLCETIAGDVDSWRTTNQPNRQTTAPPRR
jgi:AcrR family transcriptional regulator